MTQDRATQGRSLVPLPAVVAHADWSIDPKKRWVASAILGGDRRYRAVACRTVGPLPAFLDGLAALAGPAGAVFLGFDLPLGLPARYAARAGIEDFRATLPRLGSGRWRNFFDVAALPGEVSPLRPFYPARAGAPGTVIVGGGFIGLEVAASARRRGCAVTVLEAADRLMGRAVLPEVSKAFLDLHREQGVDVLLDRAIGRLEGSDRVTHAVTASGDSRAADLVVIGVGIVPDTGLAEAAGLAVDNGIVVDEFCRTSDPAIFAAGDVTRHFNPLCGRHIRLEAWQNAQNQAIAAARVMCGEETPFSEVPWMWSDQFDANLQVAGLPESWDDVVIRGDTAARDFIAFQMQDADVVGAMAVNRPRDMRFARRLIGTGRKFASSELADEAVKLRDLAKG